MPNGSFVLTILEMFVSLKFVFPIFLLLYVFSLLLSLMRR